MADWCPCDGRELSAADYPELFSLIHRAYGGESGSATFAVPDFRDSDDPFEYADGEFGFMIKASSGGADPMPVGTLLWGRLKWTS